MELRSETYTTEILHPAHDFERRSSTVEARWDPLTGHGARVFSAPGGLFPPSAYDLSELAAATQSTCPFCRDRVELVTPKFVPEITADGRFRRGEALLFPNLLAYAQYPSVSVYSADRHYLPLREMTPRLVADTLGVQVDFVGAVQRHRPDMAWASINANHMLPSGSSLFHPHMQGGVAASPTTFQRLLSEVPAKRYGDYLETERRIGTRYLGSTGAVEWLASFAPVGPAELRAFVPSAGSIGVGGLDTALVEELGYGVATAFNLYADLGFESCNLAVYGRPPTFNGLPLMLRTVARSNVAPLYRSDVTWMERLHWEAAVDVTPESVAERAGDRFRR